MTTYPPYEGKYPQTMKLALFKSNILPATGMMITAIKNCVVVRLVGMITKMPDIAHKIRAIRLSIWSGTTSLTTKIKKTCIKSFNNSFED